MINKFFIKRRPGVDKNIPFDSIVSKLTKLFGDSGIDREIDVEDVDENTLVLALGGDGTMLSAMHIAIATGAYVTGFNFGHVGYLVPSSVSNTRLLLSEVKQIINFDKECSTYDLVELKLPVLVSSHVLAINDFYAVPSVNGAADDFKVCINDDDSFFETKSSGIVVSTPLGSTGLAMSAGGSVLSPKSKVIEVVPMLPHTLTSRPLIVTDNSKITITATRPVVMFADGRYVSEFEGGETITVYKKNHKLKLIRPYDWNFYDNLKDKMKWST